MFLFGKLRDLSTSKYEVEVGKELRDYIGVKDVEIAFYELPDSDGHGTEFILGFLRQNLLTKIPFRLKWPC